jgi:galactokinase
VPVEEVAAFAPGRVNVIGEHTDYNLGLALPFAIAEGVTVRARAEGGDGGRILAIASDLDERDELMLAAPGPAQGWRAFVHGAVAELTAAGVPLAGGVLEISGGVPQGAGLSSSAALTIALCLALIELGRPDDVAPGTLPLERVELARLCSRVENDWTGARTGLLDQLASLYGAPETALRIDFASLAVVPVPMRLQGCRLVVADSGERHVHAGSGYNERREECARACRLLGVGSLREARPERLSELPEPLVRRARHVLEENLRVQEAVAVLLEGRPEQLGPLLNASHASLRDLYEISTPAVEATVRRLLDAGALGARIVGGGFGGSVLGLIPPDLAIPAGCLEVRPGPGAHLLG